MGNCGGCLEKEWKTGYAFSKEGKTQYLESIYKLCRDIPSKCSNVNILMIGNMSSGKSSFTNTLRTAMEKGCSHVATSATVHGENYESVTSVLHKVVLRHGPNGKSIRVFDCRGFPQEQCRHAFVSDLQKTIMGFIKDGYQFANNEIKENDPYYRENPSISDRMHCVVFVIKATDFITTPPNYEILRKMQTYLERHCVPLRLVLTTIDLLGLCESHPELYHVYKSKKVKEKVEAAEKKFGLSKASILPVANYVNETRPTIRKDNLALDALDNILQQAVFFIKDNL